MLQLFERRPDLRSAYVFADHLEATLDLAEELELLHLILPEPDATAGSDVLAGLDRIGTFVERIEVLELAIAAKLDLARAAARRIAARDARLATFSKLFHAGTQPLVDLYPALADPGGRIFDSGHDPLTFLQARGTIDESRCTLEGLKFLGTGEDYLLLGTVKLGAFIELCDTCLKAIDRHYHLYEADSDWEANHAERLELLHQRREEAIRQALGAQAPVIDAPVQIVPPDAVDEAIDLIEALTFPEEKRFAPEAEPADVWDAPPVELSPDAMAEAPIELPADAVGAEAAVEVAADAEAETEAEEIVQELSLEDELPEDALSLDFAPIMVEPEVVAAAAIAEPAAVVETADVEPAPELARPAETPAIEPRLLAPLASARKSLLAFLSRRHADPAESDETAAPVDADAPEAALVEAAIATITIASVAGTPEVSLELTTARQRLVDLIAERARLPSQKGERREPGRVNDVAEVTPEGETLLEAAADAVAVVKTEPQATAPEAVVAEVGINQAVPEAVGEDAHPAMDTAGMAAGPVEVPAPHGAEETNDLEIAAMPVDPIIETAKPGPAPRKRRRRKGGVANRRRAKKSRG